MTLRGMTTVKLARAVVTWLALAGGVACLDPFQPPAGAYSFDAPDVYLAAWQSVEECSGLRGEFRRVHWHVVPGSVIQFEGLEANGIWHSPHEIYLSDRAAHSTTSDYFTVRHEMLHDLLNDGTHPPVFETCGLLRK